MGIAEGVKRVATSALDQVKRALQSNAGVPQARTAAKEKSAAQADHTELSSRAQAQSPQASRVASTEEPSKSELPEASPKGVRQLGADNLFRCNEETQQLATEMVAEGVCEADELLILQAPDKYGNEIKVDPGADGGLKVEIEGEVYEYSAEEARRLIIAGGDKGNNITVSEEVKTGLNIAGGERKDTIQGGSGHDRIYAGEGDNEIHGGKGNDTIKAGDGDNKIFGGAGHDKIDTGNGRNYVDAGTGNDEVSTGSGMDTIYGGDGQDIIRGGAGKDYIDGGRGDDKLYGQAGDDVLMGGRGDDYLDGGSGSDVLAGGYDKDTIRSGTGRDKITTAFGRNSDEVLDKSKIDTREWVNPLEIPDNIKIVDQKFDGKDYSDGVEYENFERRVMDDLESIASLAYGRDLLQDLGNSNRQITIGEQTNPNGRCNWSTPTDLIGKIDNFFTGSFDAQVYYNPTFDSNYSSRYEWSDAPPVVIMLHEMCHAYNATEGNIAKEINIKETYIDEEGRTQEQYTDGAEYQAVGLDLEGVEANPEYATENGWRRYFNLPERLAYTGMPEATEAKIVPEEEVPKN